MSVDGFDPNQLEKLANWQMPFGKYKGWRLIDLPEPYVLWFNKADIAGGELKGLMQTLYEVKLNGLEHLIRPLRQ